MIENCMTGRSARKINHSVFTLRPSTYGMRYAAKRAAPEIGRPVSLSTNITPCDEWDNLSRSARQHEIKGS